LPFVNLIFTKPKFADRQVYFHAEWREKFADKSRRFSKVSRQRKLFQVFNRVQQLKFSFCRSAGGELRLSPANIANDIYRRQFGRLTFLAVNKITFVLKNVLKIRLCKPSEK
jgi:hypothetical protein